MDQLDCKEIEKHSIEKSDENRLNFSPKTNNWAQGNINVAFFGIVDIKYKNLVIHIAKEWEKMKPNISFIFEYEPYIKPNVIIAFDYENISWAYNGTDNVIVEKKNSPTVNIVTTSKALVARNIRHQLGHGIILFIIYFLYYIVIGLKHSYFNDDKNSIMHFPLNTTNLAITEADSLFCAKYCNDEKFRIELENKFQPEKNKSETIFPVSASNREKKRICILCERKPADMINIKCGDSSWCNECLEFLPGSGIIKCPICGDDIDEFINKN